MRLYQTGFELDNEIITQGIRVIIGDRWTFSGGVFFGDGVGKPWVHTTPQGYGGQNCIYSTTSSGWFWSRRLPFNFKDGWIGVAIHTPTDEQMRFGFDNALEGDIFRPQMEIVLDPSGSTELWLGNSTGGGTLVDTGNFILTPGYHWYAIRYRIGNSGGLFEVYADNVLLLSHTGDTRASATYDYWDRFSGLLGRGSAIDDFVVNGITISYTGGSGGGGTPAIGNTVTGGVTGAQAVITAYKETSPGVGYLLLQAPTAGFNPTEGVSDGSGWSATLNLVGGTFGFDKNSGKPDETYIVVTRPNGTVSAGLNGSDGDQVDNHLQVNDTFTSEATYNFTSSAGTEDVYTMTSLPFSPGTIDAVEPVIYANRAGGITGARTIIDPGLGNTYSEDLQIGSGGTSVRAGKIYDVNPDTGTDWSESDVNNTDVGVRFV